MTSLLAGYKDRITGLLSRKKNPGLPIEDVSYVVIDTELTGLDVKKDFLISIGAVKMHGGTIEIGNNFFRLINPQTVMSRESVVVHGITPSEVAGELPIDKVICELIDFCGNDVIVGHFILLDMGFINRGIKRVCDRLLANPLLDTHKIYEWIMSNNRGFSRDYNSTRDELTLFAIARKYKIPIIGAHNALNDSFITAQLFQRFLSALPGLGVRTLSDLLHIGKP